MLRPWRIIGDGFRTRALNNTRERKTGRDILYRGRERERKNGRTHTHPDRDIDCIYAYGKRSHPLAFIIDNDTVDEA